MTSPPPPAGFRAVTRPVPVAELDDPRRYHLDQVRRRFRPVESSSSSSSSLVTPTDDTTTSLVFDLVPSDPDFPFDLARLRCDLRVPPDYPARPPRLRVSDSHLPRGFGLNVERGWDRLVREREGASLLALIHALDRNLESFLSEQEAETMTATARPATFKDTRHLQHQHQQKHEQTHTHTHTAVPVLKSPKSAVMAEQPVAATKPYVAEKRHSRQEIAAAKEQRAQQIRQLETRMGRLPLYRRSADDVVFTLPLEPKNRTHLPPGLRSVNNIHLIVPFLYPLQDIRVQLNEAEAADAEPVEDLFAERAAAQKQMTLTGHVNYLAQNLHILAKTAQRNAEKKRVEAESKVSEEAHPSCDDGKKDERNVAGKGHVHHLPLPPEWTMEQDDDGSSSDEESSSSDEDGGVDLDEGEEQAPSLAVSDVAGNGTMITFPSVELLGAELVQVSSLSLTIRCERCRTRNDMTGIQPGVEKTGECSRCGTVLWVRYAAQYVHEHSSRAGLVELCGGAVADMLPSTFVVTCSRCSRPSHGLVSVQGERVTNVCRACHGKFTFTIREVKFLVIGSGSSSSDNQPGLGRRKKKAADEGLAAGLHGGESLPNKGACAHYRRSYRWFRFGCCGRVFACDLCHRAESDHEAEWATRMICGWCSREQRYAVATCGFCGRGVVGGKGKRTAFWEGGKGRRDQRTMSRKDPRKYKRIGRAA